MVAGTQQTTSITSSSSFILIGLMIWGIRAYKTDQIEPNEYKLSKHATAPDLSKRELNV